MDCKFRTKLSWSFLAAGIIFTFALQLPYKIIAFSFLPYLFIRSTKEDKGYWKEISSNPGALLKLVFIYMLSWLTYILFNYYQTEPIGTFRLTTIQWGFFICPLPILFIYYELKWYLTCEN